ncbi:hypothetical protein [Brevundimonas sp.]|uniref:hypothetical protein n=1 Tax=Brevundimonas sp. TaxID=1871086 RepID=UPI0027300D22|nr:hypothetical protein [Brevundimonas sp.]MDP1912727.1 hypothetical protein [Brevundimonas sp.]
MQVSGTIYIGEAAGWAQRACSRLNGYPWSMLIALVVALAGMGLAGVLAVFAGVFLDVLQDWWGLTFAGLALLVIWPSMSFLRRWQIGRFRRALLQRDVQNPLPVRFEVGADGWTYVLGVVESRGPWSVISEFFPVGPYWVLLSQGSALFLAKRYFSDVAAERLFVQAVLGRLSPEAGARSDAAASFVAS